MTTSKKTLLFVLLLTLALALPLHSVRSIGNFGRLMLAATAAETPVAAATQPTVTTDKHQYFQGETMVIKGAGFRALAPVTLTVTRPDGVVVSIAGVSTGADGAFTASYLVPGINGSYRITATDGTSTADTRAADPVLGSVAEFSQCANYKGLGYPAGDSDPGCHWTNGDLNSNNSRFIEGDATVQRAFVTGLTNGTHTITFKYDTTRQGRHAYDFLVDDKLSEYWIANADMCDGAAGNGFPSCASTPLDPDGLNNMIPPDPMVGGKEESFYPGKRHIRIRNGHILTVGAPTLNGSYSGDSDTSVQVTFSVDTGTCADKGQVHSQDTCPVLITFGAHISKKSEWVGEPTASSISGSPYHVSLVEADGGGGSMDNQMKSDTIDAGLTLAKKVTDLSVNGGTAPASDWTLSATGPESFSGPGNSPEVTNVALPPGTYNLAETGGPASGYTNGTSWKCLTNGLTETVGTSISLLATDTAVCTIENTRDTGTIELKKVWEGGAASTTLAIGTAAGGGNIASKPVTSDDTTGQKIVAAGLTYYLSETAIAHYDSTLACTDSGAPVTLGTNNSVAVAKGHAVVCTFTNRKKGTVILVKSTTGGNGIFNFTTTSGVGFPASPNLTTVNGTASQTFIDITPGGPYSITENVGSEWILTSSSCTGTGNTPASFTVPAGGTVTCTFNNTLSGHLVVQKTTLPPDSQVFSITASGTGTIEGGGAGTVTDATDHTYKVAPGTYSVVETVPPGWDQTGNTCTGIPIASGETKTCLITNTKRGHLIVQKTTDPVGDTTPFTINASGTGTITGGGAGTVTDATDKDYEVTPGTYSVTETVPAGWDKTGDTCQNVSVAAGQTVYCLLTNTKRGHLIVQKTTDPTGDTTVFTINATGTGAITGGGAATVTDTLDKDYEVTPGTYSVAETVPDGWSKTGDTCQNVVVSAGKTETCLLTNVKHGHLIVQKTTDPPNDPTEFSITASGSGTIFGGAAGKVTDAIDKDYEVMPGTYSVAEAVPAGWDKTGDTCQNVAVAAGATVRCTITNVKRGHIIVEKTTLPAGDQQVFQVNASGTGTVTNGSAATVTDALDHDFEVTPGTYSVTETVPAGWDKTRDMCQNVVVAAGQIVHCELENTKRGHIIVEKTTFPAGDTTAFTITASPAGTVTNGSVATVTDAIDHDYEVKPGTYFVAETVPMGWQNTGDTCQGVSVGPGETKHCQLTNTKLGKITIYKATVAGTNTFQYTATGLSPSPFYLSGGGNQVFNNVPVAYGTSSGDYTITEANLTGWQLTSLACNTTGSPDANTTASGDVGTGVSTIHLAPGGVASCTYTNNKLPTITIVKTIKGDPATFTFDITGAAASSRTISVTTANGSATDGPFAVPIGTYTIAEQTQPHWTLTDISCTMGSAGPDLVAPLGVPDNWSFSLAWGDNVTCSFVNNGLLATRTQGFWSTHTALANSVWAGTSSIPDATTVVGSGDDVLCGTRTITADPAPGANILMGGFWANVSQKSSGTGKDAKRSEIDQARMQMLQQYLAAVLNAHAFGFTNKAAMLSTARDAYCNGNANDIKGQIGILGTFNTSGDTIKFTPGASATAQLSRTQANIPYWDVTK